VQKLRVEYWQQVKQVDPENLIFIDEMGVLLGLTRTRQEVFKEVGYMILNHFTEGQR